MLFNSYVFLFLFLPTVVLFYFVLTRSGYSWPGKLFLVLASWFFYAWWNPAYLPLLLSSIAVNFSMGKAILARPEQSGGVRKRLMIIGVLFNVGLLGYFKYMDFFLGNLNRLGLEVPLLNLALPLAISFFSLQQIAYIVDAYRRVESRGGLLDYCIFVSFFPQLIAGPIVHHKEIIPQLREPGNQLPSFANLSMGLFLFSMGLFKKVVLADSFAVWASNGFDLATSLSFTESWIVSYSYTLQLYFDFSGYSDMAIGLALMFNIRLPLNFNSPYKATSIINLWQRWHLTLTRFINMYVYKPILRALPRVSFSNGLIASFLAMVIAGVWHGAAWSFVIFGILQGIVIVINHIWRKLKLPMPDFLGWLLTFHCFSFSLVIFRAVQWPDAAKVYRGMLGLSGTDPWISVSTIFGDQVYWFFSYAQGVTETSILATVTCVTMLVLFIAHVALLPNSNRLLERFQFNTRSLLATLFLFLVPLLLLGSPSEFIYYQF